MGSTTQKIQQVKEDWSSVIDLANAFFSTSENSQPQFAFIWKKSQFTFTVIPQGYVNSLAYCHDLVRRDLDLMQVSSVIIHHILMTVR